MSAACDLMPRGDREAELLIHCARASIEPGRVERVRRLAAGELDWARVLSLAERHGLRPLLYWHLNRICAAAVPAPTFAFLREYFQKNSAFNLLLTGELLRIVEVLKAGGIQAMPFKGPADAARLYGHIALRQFCDIDLLVRECDVWRAGEILEQRGFRPQFVIPEEWREAHIRQSYVQLFRRDAGRTLVELHWGIAPPYFAVRFDADGLWRRVTQVTLQGTTVPAPSREDLLLMLCVHGCKHGWDKLEGLSAVAELLRQPERFDWEHAWRQAGEMRCRRMLVLSLLLVNGLFEIPMPRVAEAWSRSRTLRALAREVVRYSLDLGAPPRRFARVAALHLRCRDRFSDIGRYCARVCFTPSAEDWAALRLHRRLAFGYRFVHAARVACAPFNHKPAGG